MGLFGERALSLPLCLHTSVHTVIGLDRKTANWAFFSFSIMRGAYFGLAKWSGAFVRGWEEFHTHSQGHTGREGERKTKERDADFRRRS